MHKAPRCAIPSVIRQSASPLQDCRITASWLLQLFYGSSHYREDVELDTGLANKCALPVTWLYPLPRRLA
jgi:hypothetical protein